MSSPNPSPPAAEYLTLAVDTTVDPESGAISRTYHTRDGFPERLRFSPDMLAHLDPAGPIVASLSVIVTTEDGTAAYWHGTGDPTEGNGLVMRRTFLSTESERS
jgi:hypothetical protein